MEMVHPQEHRQEFLEGFYFTPSELEKSGPGWIIRAGLSQAKPNYHMGPKISHYHYLIFVIKGEGRLNQNGQTYHLKPNDLFCLFPNTTHEYYTLKHAPMLTVWVAFDGRQVNELLARAGLHPAQPYATQALSEELTDCLTAFFERCREAGNKATDLFRLRFFYSLFEHLASAKAGGLLDNGTESWLKRGMEYIQMHYAQGITIENICASISVDRTHFTKKFTERYGLSPGRYMQQLKMSEAKRLLTETDYKLTEVAKQVGYPDLFSFSKGFKKAYGVPPSRYRPEAGGTKTITPTLATNIIAVHGKPGEQWVRDLPRLLTYCENKWAIRVQPPLSSNGYHYIAPVVFDNGMEAVLKLGVPCRGFTSEAEALRQFDGKGTVGLIDAEADRGIMLLEKAIPMVPGSAPLDARSEAEAVSIWAQQASILNRSAPDLAVEFAFETTQDWSQDFEDMKRYLEHGGSFVEAGLMQTAHACLLRLHAKPGALRLLHGNLIPPHILPSRSGWSAIHPKGVVAPAEYEAVPYLVYRLPQRHMRETLRHRMELIAHELGCSTRRLAEWGLCHSILTAWRSLQEQRAANETAIQTAAIFGEWLGETNRESGASRHDHHHRQRLQEG